MRSPEDNPELPSTARDGPRLARLCRWPEEGRTRSPARFMARQNMTSSNRMRVENNCSGGSAGRRTNGYRQPRFVVPSSWRTTSVADDGTPPQGGLRSTTHTGGPGRITARGAVRAGDRMGSRLGG